MALTSRAALGQCGTSSSTRSRSTISSCLMCAQPQEWRAGHIAEALCITGAEFPARSEEVPRDQPVSVCCWRSVSLLGHGELAPAPWSPAGRQYCWRHGWLAGRRSEDYAGLMRRMWCIMPTLGRRLSAEDGSAAQELPTFTEMRHACGGMAGRVHGRVRRREALGVA